jgi:hypothetical protein
MRVTTRSVGEDGGRWEAKLRDLVVVKVDVAGDGSSRQG